jgi:hypothetical protein
MYTIHTNIMRPSGFTFFGSGGFDTDVLHFKVMNDGTDGDYDNVRAFIEKMDEK